jgi:hypothetical protein
MRLQRLLAGLLGVSMLSLPGVLAAAPAAAAAETASTQITLELEKKKMRYGDTFAVAGQITATSDGGTGYVDSAPLALQRRLPGQVWKTVQKTTSTGYDGTFRLSVKAKQNARYRMSYAGETRGSDGAEVELQPSTSPERNIRVARDFDLSSVKKGGGIILKGRVLPTYKKKVVQIQQRKCGKCRWKAYKKVRTDKRSRFSLRVAVPATATWDYRARTASTKAFINSTSTEYLSVYRF